MLEWVERAFGTVNFIIGKVLSVLLLLIAMNLQTSFLTAPFGFSRFYLKGGCPPGVRTTDLYRGVIPFIVIYFMVLSSLVVFPGLYGFK
jgi:TRAP-type mannitol/chloroaromatic compound transport system permease large subunit